MTRWDNLFILSFIVVYRPVFEHFPYSFRKKNDNELFIPLYIDR